MATLLKTDGTQQERFPSSPPLFTLDELQSLVGGRIQILNGGLVVNEDGRNLGLPFNAEASRRFGSVLRGDVVVLTAEELAAAQA